MRILLAIDESDFSTAATQAVIAQASPADKVRVVHVVDVARPVIEEMRQYYPGVEHALDAQRKPAEGLLDRTAKLLRSTGLEVVTTLEWGDDPRSKVIDLAANWPADLIVLGSHGTTGLDRLLMGSVSDAVMRHAQCSIELVRIPNATEDLRIPSSVPQEMFKRILLAIDDSEFSRTAENLLGAQARPHITEVRVLHVAESPPLLASREMAAYHSALEMAWEAQRERARELVKQTVARLRARKLEVHAMCEEGDAKSKILDIAKDWPADLIVLGSHGRKGLTRFMLGSIAETVARYALCSVEIVRAFATD